MILSDDFFPIEKVTFVATRINLAPSGY